MADNEVFHWKGPLPAPDFVMVPKLVLRLILRHLSGGEFKVFYVLMHKAYEWGNVSAEISLGELTELAGISRSTAIAAIKALEEKGLVETIAHESARGDRDANTYRLLITDDPRYTEGRSKIDPPRSENRSTRIDLRSTTRARSSRSRNTPKEDTPTHHNKYATGRYAVCSRCSSRPCVCAS